MRTTARTHPPRRKKRRPNRPRPPPAAPSRSGWRSRSSATTIRRRAWTARREARGAERARSVSERAPVVSLARADVNLTRPRDLLLLVEEHLLPLRQPSRRTRDREEHGEEVHRELHRTVDEPPVEVHVGIELSRNEVVIRKRDALELEGDLQILVDPDFREHLVRQRLHDACARIVALVHAVTETHEATALPRLHLIDE